MSASARSGMHIGLLVRTTRVRCGLCAANSSAGGSGVHVGHARRLGVVDEPPATRSLS